MKTLSVKSWCFLGVFLVVLLSVLSGVPPTTVPTVHALGAPIFLSGDDADANGHCQGTACGAFYPTALNFVYNNSTTSGTIIAVIGANSGQARTGFNSWNNTGNGGPGAATDFLSTTSTPSIASADLSATGPYRMIYIASNKTNTSGGLTTSQLAALNLRQTDLVNFVNILGGGLMALTGANDAAQYGWLPLSLTTDNVSHIGADTILTTPEMASIATVAPGDLNHGCCYHTVFTGPAGFSGLTVLAFHDHDGNGVYDGEASSDHVLMLGGANVTIQGNISLEPDSSINFTGTGHTVTAFAEDGSPLIPAAGVTVTFTVSGLNATSGTATTDANGDASFTYVGNNAGTDIIAAAFVDAAGNTQTSNSVTKTWEVAPAVAGDFLGYDIKKVDPKFEKVVVTLTDQFVSGQFRVEKPDRLYTPADTEILPDKADGAQVAGLPVDLMRYKVKFAKDATGEKEKKVKIKNILVANEFGTFLVEASGPDHLLVPTTKSLADDPPPGQPTGNVDHFLCYKIKHAKIGIDVSVADQFGVKDLEVKHAKSLCNPVEKTHDGIETQVQNPEMHLMCFDVKNGEKQDIEVNTNNQFGAGSMVVHKPKELCVPSTIEVAEPPEPIVDGCTTKVHSMLLRYTGPSISDDGDDSTTVTVTVVSKKGQTAEYILPELISGVTELSKVEQADSTIDAHAAGETELGSKTSIFIDGVEEVIHTSCSAPFKADEPAPLDDPKGDPSPNWFVVGFTQT